MNVPPVVTKVSVDAQGRMVLPKWLRASSAPIPASSPSAGRRHEHHGLARPHLIRQAAVPVIVLAETFAQLRRTFGRPADVATRVLRPWVDDPVRMLGTPADAMATVLQRAVGLDLGGNVHDALVAQVCAQHGTPLVTLDRPQHTVALTLGADSTSLLAQTAGLLPLSTDPGPA